MIRLLSVFSVFILIVGCANLVSSPEDKIPQGGEIPDEIRFVLTFKSALNFNDFDYYLVFSSTSNLTVRDINLPDIFYFLPGDGAVNIGDFEGQNELFDEFQDYFGTFFSTWSDFIRISGTNVDSDLDLMNGAFSSTVNTAQENQDFVGNLDLNFSPSLFDVNTQTITIRFPIDSLSFAAGETLFFNFITVDKVDSFNRRLAFFLEDDEDNSIQLTLGEVKTRDPNQDGTDIERWEVRILQL